MTEDESASTSSQIKLTWVEGELNNAGIIGYKVYANDGLGGALALLATVGSVTTRIQLPAFSLQYRNFQPPLLPSPSTN